MRVKNLLKFKLIRTQVFFRRPKGFTSIYEHSSIGVIDIICVDPFVVGRPTFGDCGTVDGAGIDELYAFFIYFIFSVN